MLKKPSNLGGSQVVLGEAGVYWYDIYILHLRGWILEGTRVAVWGTGL